MLVATKYAFSLQALYIHRTWIKHNPINPKKLKQLQKIRYQIAKKLKIAVICRCATDPPPHTTNTCLHYSPIISYSDDIRGPGNPWILTPVNCHFNSPSVKINALRSKYTRYCHILRRNVVWIKICRL